MGITFFDRDITKIPCFRESFLYGIGSYFVGGLVYFMFTSKVKTASHFGFVTFNLVTLSYWVVCRHRWAVNKFNMGQIQEFMVSAIETQGTKDEIEIADDKSSASLNDEN